jgi:hypothetical protein
VAELFKSCAPIGNTGAPPDDPGLVDRAMLSIAVAAHELGQGMQEDDPVLRQ